MKSMLTSISSRKMWIAAAALLCCLPAVHSQTVPKSVAPLLAQRPAANPTIPPAVLPLVSRTIGRDDARYQAQWKDATARFVNPAQLLQARFTARGIDISGAQTRWSLALAGFGYASRMTVVEPVAPVSAANRVEYRRGALTEWYVNGPLGIEQGFTLPRAPRKSGRASYKADDPLSISLAMAGGLTASVEDGGRALMLTRNGVRMLRYGGLHATDARGRELPAWLEVAASRLLVRVDDRAAAYPVTIDPLVEAAKLTTNDGMLPFLGVSAAVSSDGKTVVLGAPQDFADNPPLGSAYVFVESSNGWNDATPVARLTASDGVNDDFFGWGVAISGDGNLIIVGAARANIGANQQQGAAYVYTKPSGGWADSTEQAKLTPSDGQAGSYFPGGMAVNNNGSTLILTGRYPGTGPSSLVSDFTGKAYVFTRPLTSIGWGNFRQAAVLTNSDQNNGCYTDPMSFCDEFGASASISNDGKTVVVGATNTLPGKAYVYEKPDTGWVDATETAKLTTTDGAYQFGISSISADGSTIAIGALQAPYPHGAVYIYERSGSDWVAATQNAKLTTSDTPNFLGGAVSISGDGKNVAAEAYCGFGDNCVYVYVAPDTGWTDATETVALPSAPYDESGIAFNNDGTALVIGKPDSNLAYVYTSSALSDFTISPVSGLTLGPGTSGSSSVTINSFDGFNSAVSFSTSSVPTGVTATAAPVTPAAGGSATTQVNVTAGLAAMQGMYTFDLTGTSGSLSHTVSVNLTIVVSPASVTNVISQEQALGCIDNAGISNALTMKLAQAQQLIAAGDIQSAINTLEALLNQLYAQQGKHIKTTCTDMNGNTFDPDQVLIADVQALLANLGAATIKPNPIMGYAVNSSGVGVYGATISLVDSSKNIIASTATDATGFYFFARTSGLANGMTYTIKDSPPKPYKSGTSVSFTWAGNMVTANSGVN